MSKRRLKSIRKSVQRALRLEMLESRVVMSTFQVNTTLDTVAVDLRTGKDASGHVSLRSAIMAANASRLRHDQVAAGTYKLTIAGADEDGERNGRS